MGRMCDYLFSRLVSPIVDSPSLFPNLVVDLIVPSSLVVRLVHYFLVFFFVLLALHPCLFQSCSLLRFLGRCLSLATAVQPPIPAISVVLSHLFGPNVLFESFLLHVTTQLLGDTPLKHLEDDCLNCLCNFDSDIHRCNTCQSFQGKLSDTFSGLRLNGREISCNLLIESSVGKFAVKLVHSQIDFELDLSSDKTFDGLCSAINDINSTVLGNIL